jgi:hypothetical protein
MPGFGQLSGISEAWIELTSGARDWSTFWSLTFRDEVSNETALNTWRRLVRSLNIEAMGKTYTRKVGHSYFPYLLGVERQTRGVLHFHVVTARPIDFHLVHTLWNYMAGFALLKRITDREGAVKYVCKYAVKGGDVYYYLEADHVRNYKPKKSFTWWRYQ